MIMVKKLESGYYLVRGFGPCNFAQPPKWPCQDIEILRQAAHPEAGEMFLHEASRSTAPADGKWHAR